MTADSIAREVVLEARFGVRSGGVLAPLASRSPGFGAITTSTSTEGSAGHGTLPKASHAAGRLQSRFARLTMRVVGTLAVQPVTPPLKPSTRSPTPHSPKQSALTALKQKPGRPGGHWPAGRPAPTLRVRQLNMRIPIQGTHPTGPMLWSPCSLLATPRWRCGAHCFSTHCVGVVLSHTAAGTG